MTTQTPYGQGPPGVPAAAVVGPAGFSMPAVSGQVTLQLGLLPNGAFTSSIWMIPGQNVAIATAGTLEVIATPTPTSVTVQNNGISGNAPPNTLIAGGVAIGAGGSATGGTPAPTYVRVFDGAGTNSPYSVQSTDATITFDNSSAGAAMQANLPAAPTIGERHKFKWSKEQSIASTPPTINGNGNNVESVQSPGTFGPTATLSPFGETAEWQFLTVASGVNAWALIG